MAKRAEEKAAAARREAEAKAAQEKEAAEKVCIVFSRIIFNQLRISTK